MADIPNTQPDSRETTILDAPDKTISIREVFGSIPTCNAPRSARRTSACPISTRPMCSILIQLWRSWRASRTIGGVMIQGYHGTGKSTHIEQVAARLNWPCIRINLDAHISRIDLIGRDAIVLRDGQQVTEFREGLLPWALQTPTALEFDEYDAGRPDVMFVTPARARDRGQADAARPEPRDPAQSLVPPVLDRQHGRPRRYQRALPRHPADQSGARWTAGTSS